MVLVDTPDAKTIDELVTQFNLPIEKTVKTLVVEASEDSEHSLIALLIRGDHELNEVKAEKLPQVKAPLTMAQKLKFATPLVPDRVHSARLTFPFRFWSTVLSATWLISVLAPTRMANTTSTSTGSAMLP